MNHEEPIEPTKTQQTRERILGELVQCKFCENEFHPAGGTDYKTDVNGDWVCEECAKGAVVEAVYTSVAGHGYSGYAERDGTSISTKYFPTKAEALFCVLEMAAALWPNKPIIEE